MDALTTNSSHDTNSNAGVPPAPPEAPHQAGAGIVGLRNDLLRLAQQALVEIETAKSFDEVDEAMAWAHEVAAWDLAYQVGLEQPELLQPPTVFRGSRTLMFGWAKGRSAAILNARCDAA